MRSPYLNSEEVAIRLRFFKKLKDATGAVVGEVPDKQRAREYVTRMGLPTKRAGSWFLVREDDLEQSLTPSLVVSRPRRSGWSSPQKARTA